MGLENSINYTIKAHNQNIQKHVLNVTALNMHGNFPTNFHHPMLHTAILQYIWFKQDLID